MDFVKQIEELISSGEAFFSDLIATKTGPVKELAEDGLKTLKMAGPTIEHHASEYAKEQTKRLREMTLLVKYVRNIAKPSMPVGDRPRADELANIMENDKAVLAGGLAISGSTSGDINTILDPLAEIFRKLSTKSGVSAKGKKLCRHLQLQIQTVRFGFAPKAGEQATLDLVATVHAKTIDVSQRVTDQDVADSLSSDAKVFLHVLTRLTGLSISNLLLKLGESGDALGEVNAELKKRYEDILKFEAGAKRCAAILKTIGQGLTLAAAL